MTQIGDSGVTAGLSRRAVVQHAAMGAGVVAGLGWIDASAQTTDASATPTDAAIPDDFKVVLHAAEIADWNYVVSNLHNLTQEWPRARLRVVVDGSAVTALQGANNLTRALGDFADKGVLIQICPNALRDQGIAPDTIPSYANTALGGVVALVLAQHEGYAYVKP